jgi:hypothetical protein
MSMSSELILGIIGTITGIIGTITGLTNLILKRVQEKPRLKISNSMFSLQKEGDRLNVDVSFNVDNSGDRATTIVRLIVVLGPDVEVIERLTNLSAHSSIRIPEKRDSSISFSFPRDIEFLDGTQKQYFVKQEKLTVTVIHTHGEVKKSYDLPPSSQWEKQAVLKDEPTVLFLG